MSLSLWEDLLGTVGDLAHARQPGEIDRKGRALTWRTGNHNSTSITGDDTMYHRKAHAGPFSWAFRCKERIENTLQHLWRHAVASIPDGEAYVWSWREV